MKTAQELARNVAFRFAADLGGSEDFMKALESQLQIQDRVIRMDNVNRYGGVRYGTVIVNFYNLPKDIAAGRGGGGAEAENNRLMVVIEGFGEETPHSPPPSGKVKLRVSALAIPREYSPRGKTGTPAQVAKYLADTLNKIVKEVPPRLTHTTV